MKVLHQSLQQIACIADNVDPLASKRKLFDLPEGVIYLDGNSLGALPKICKQRAIEVINQQWGTDLISSWNTHNWIDLPHVVGEKIAPIIGAQAGQTMCCDSISVNLFKVLSGALKMQKNRSIVLSQSDNFPTDLYMVQGLTSLISEQHCKLKLVEEDDIAPSLNSEVAVLMLTHVNFRSGRIHDMKRLTQMAHEQGILVIWDLAHSAGAVELALDECEVDFAVGCTYKYLNGGPGAPGFIYVAKRHQRHFQQPLYGWMGHASPFAFDKHYQASPTISQNLTGTPAILSMSVLDAALSVFDNIEMRLIREKSIKLTEFFIQCLSELELNETLALSSPQDPTKRGSQISVAHKDAYAICQALIDEGVIADFRAPDILRFGFTPLYTRHIDVLNAAIRLGEIVNSRRYDQARFREKAKVT
ncbi:MAG: kynureninase [Aliiglaciecola sp.]